MKKKLLFLCFVVTSTLLLSQNINNNNTKPVFFSIDLKKNVSNTTWLYIKNGFAEADSLRAKAIIVEMNTYGGEVVFADSIRTKILNTDIPVYVYIDKNAASAGALISIACDKIYMQHGGTIGAATVVDQSGSKLPDKYQSYMRATMRATAEAQGKDTIVAGNDTTYRWKRDPLIAEAMVDERTVIPNVIDSGKILTFTTEEALKFGYCDGIAGSAREIIQKEYGNVPYELVKYKPSAFDNIKGFLTSPIFQGILIMLIIGGLYFELQTPGIGFALAVSVIAAILYFAPLYIDGLAANWEILLFVVGIALIILELFAFPGFGVAGISGVVLAIGGLTLSLIGNIRFDFRPVHTDDAATALITVTIGLILSFLLILYLSSKIGSKGFFKRLALDTKLGTDSGYISVPTEPKRLVGKDGMTYTVLRPSGRVRIDDDVYDAVSLNGTFIDKDTTVRVVKYETGQLYVSEVRD